MANIEKITYKGDVYDISDAKAMHQDAAGSWMPDFDALKPIETHEWTIATTATGVICERANFTDINNARDVLAFRITVDASSGTSIHQVADVIVRLQPTANTTPLVMVINRSRSTTAANTGFRYLYTVYPKAANTNYKYQLAIYPYNATSRKVKVEVFKKTDDWTFTDSRTAYSYNSDYQTRNDMTIYTSLGVICNYTQYMTTSYSNYAGYISSWLPYFNSSYSELTTGASVSASQLCFIGEDGKAYPASNTTAAVDTAYPPFYASSAVSNATAMTWSYVRRFGVVTIPTSIGRDTLAAGEPVYMRCTNSNGKVYSANKITHDLTTGYTYVKIGRMHSSTVTCFDTYNSQYFTVNNDRITRLNNIPLEAELAAAIDRQLYISQTGNYGVLLDNNQITDLTTSTMSPKVAGALTFNPSTGNLSSTLFTGSGAGLTNVPADELNGVVGMGAGGTGIDASGSGDYYATTKLHPRFQVNLFGTTWSCDYRGPISENIQSVADALGDSAVLLALRSLVPVYTSGYLGFHGVIITDIANNNPYDIYVLFPDAILFGGVYVNGIKGTLTYTASDGIYLSNITVSQPSWLGAGFQTTSNLVTSISSSSTDTEYPSAKCVYDAISGISPGGGSGEGHGYYVGTCTTGASTSEKAVTVSDSTFTLHDGVRLSVYMTTANTSQTPKLNVNSTGAHSIVISHFGNTDFTSIGNAALLQAFSKPGIFDFKYYAAWSGASTGAWVLDYEPYAMALGGRYANGSRGTTCDYAHVTDGGLRYGLVTASATHAPFSLGVNALISMFHDSNAAYTRQIAMSTGSAPKMAIRTQNNTAWSAWRYVMTAPTNDSYQQCTYTYSGQLSIDSNTMTIPINGTKYRLTQLQLVNLDPDFVLGVNELYLFNIAGTSAYSSGNVTKYLSAASTSTDITITFTGTVIDGSTNVQTIAYYAEKV